jgi:hypothetical protein
MQAALITGLALFLMAGSASAAPLCTSYTNLGELMGLGAGGCNNVSGSLLFSNFAYAPSGSDPAAAAVTFNPTAQGFSFNPVGNATWIAGFTLSFTVAATAPGMGIVASYDQMNAGILPQSTSLVVDTQTATFGGALLGTVSMSGASTTTQGGQLIFSTPSVNVVDVATISGGTHILSLEQGFYTGAVPEPATLSMIGGALLGLGFMLRRKKA